MGIWIALAACVVLFGFIIVPACSGAYREPEQQQPQQHRCTDADRQPSRPG
jgi:hypothetical protein